MSKVIDTVVIGAMIKNRSATVMAPKTPSLHHIRAPYAAFRFL
jgi:hypothetical protein